MNRKNKTVFITGISGWIAQFCAVELIKSGFHVKGSLRTMSRKDEVIDAIGSKVDPTGLLTFCELDLTKDAGWDKAMIGCEYLLHIASPFILSEPKDSQSLLYQQEMEPF